MIKLLDCTLRDGGYINNWEFGKQQIYEMINDLEATQVEILEIGFLKDEPYNENRSVFNRLEQADKLLQHKKDNVKYAVMCECLKPVPLDQLEEAKDSKIDIIRVMIWKTKHDSDGKEIDALVEGYEYCKGLREKGYDLCIQPARVDQYTDEEFKSMIHMYQQLDPLAIYVVDSWGTLQYETVEHYIEIADNSMKPGIALGYHGHNNLMQAQSIAQNIVEYQTERDIYIDASIYGMGRGAGNLNLELFAQHLNWKYKKEYLIDPMLKVYDKNIRPVFEIHPWGYRMSYYLTAKYNCNPNYGEYYDINKKMDTVEIEEILKKLSQDDKIMFSLEKAERYCKDAGI